jgi:hypothetical protein
MPVDILGLANNAANVVIMAILVLGIYRALQLHRAFVNPNFRSRATWSGFLMLMILITFLNNYLPSSSPLSIIGFLPFIALLMVIFAYVDKSVLITMETDFFHRDTLGWLRARKPIALVFVACLVVGVTLSDPDLGATPWENNVGFVFFLAATVGVLSYCTAAMIVGARRSSDRALRRSILLVGLALSTLVFSIAAASPFDQGSLLYVIINQGTGLVGISLIYKSVMSLSPLGRVEKELDVTSKPEASTVVIPGHP